MKGTRTILPREGEVRDFPIERVLTVDRPRPIQGSEKSERISGGKRVVPTTLSSNR